MHLLVGKASVPGCLYHRIGHGVGEVFLQTGRQAKHVCLTPPTKGNHFHHRGAGSGQGTGFVKDNGVRMGHCLQVLSAFYRHMSSAGLPHSRKHRQRHGQFQRTGKIHHENGKRPGNISCQQIRQAASQQSIGYQCIRQMGSFVLRGRFEFLRLLNHRDNFVIPAAAVLLGHLYDTLAFFHHSAGVDHRVRPLGNRNGFAGERGLVNHDLPLDNHAIHRNQAAHPHRDGIPGLDLVERNQDLPLLCMKPDTIHIQ